MSASQRHKCEIHGKTAIFDGSCPAYGAITYPPGPPIVVDPTREYAYFDGVSTTRMETGVTLDGTKDIVVGATFYIEDLPPDDGDFMCFFGCDADFQIQANMREEGPVFRVGILGANGNKLDLGTPAPLTQYVVSLTIPKTPYDGKIGVGRANNRSTTADIGSNPMTTRPLMFGWRFGGGPYAFKGLIADAFMFEDGVLVHSWPLNEGSGATATDTVGGANATLTDVQWIEGKDYNP